MIANPGAKLLDSLVYGVAVTVVVTGLGGVISLATGGAWVRLKVFLFLVGFLLFGFATITLWRSSSPKEAEVIGPEESTRTAQSTAPGEPASPAGTDGERRKRSPFESALARFAPSVDTMVPVEQRFPPALKLFVASLLVLGLSVVMEVVFGVGVD